MPWLRPLVAASEAWTASSITRSRPAKRERPSRMKCQRSSSCASGARLAVAMAPAFTIGFMVRSAFSSIAMTELKAGPVALTPMASRARPPPSAWQTSAKTKGLEMDWMESGRSASPAANTAPSTPAMQRPNQPGEAAASAGM